MPVELEVIVEVAA